MNFDHAYLGRLEPGVAVFWLVATVVASAFLCLGHDADGRVGARPSKALACLVGPWAALGISIAAFPVGHAHPLAQYNDDASRSLWRLWFDAWMPLLIGTASLAITAFVGGVACAAKQRPTSAIRWFIASSLNAFSLFAVFGNFPDC